MFLILDILISVILIFIVWRDLKSFISVEMEILNFTILSISERKLL